MKVVLARLLSFRMFIDVDHKKNFRSKANDHKIDRKKPPLKKRMPVVID